MKRVYILHYWGDKVGPRHAWYQWLKKELEKKGLKVFVPQMPHTDNPVIKERVSYLKKLVGKPDQDTYFVGHSVGCQTIMRYLETLPKGAKVGGAVFVAGWFKLKNLEDPEVKNIAKPWLQKPINFKKVKATCPIISVLLSSNEWFGYVKENKKIFEEKLNAKVKVLKNKGHFTEDDKIKRLPEVLKEFLKISQ